MNKKAQNKHFGNPAWVAYVNPFRIIVPDNEEPWNVEIDEINSNSYNHGKLCKIVSNVPIDDFEFNFLICYDGALAIPKFGKFSQKERAVDFFNNTFCELLLGGIDCEAIDRRDIVNGQLHESRAIWPVDLGNSLSSQTHAKLRMRIGNSIDSVILSAPSYIYTSEFQLRLIKGRKILASVPNLTPKFLLRGITEARYRNWDLVLSNLWITVEQLIDYLWNTNFLNNKTYHPTQVIDGRKTSLKNDNRTWSMSVKQELLFQVGILDEEIISKLHPARKSRNSLVHEGRGVTKEVAIGLINTVDLLLKKVTGENELELSKYSNSTREGRSDESKFNKDYFNQWTKD